MRSRVGLVVIFFLIALPGLALAANTSFFGPVVPECMSALGELRLCQPCDLAALAENILRIFVSLVVAAATLMFAYAGILYVTGSASKSNIDSAKNIFFKALIGLVFVLAAFLIVDLVLRVFVGEGLNVMTRIQCLKYTFTDHGPSYTTQPRQGTQEETGTTTVPTGGGGVSVAQCAEGEGMTHRAALTELTSTGLIRVTSTSGDAGVRDSCVTAQGCTTLAGICPSTVTNFSRLISDSHCGATTVYGAAEVGFPHGENSWHGKGCAFDVAPSQCLGDFLRAHGAQYGVTEVCTTSSWSAYRQNCTYNEGTDHFHLTFCR